MIITSFRNRSIHFCMGIIKKILIFTVFISVVLDYKFALIAYALNIGIIIVFILFLNLFYSITVLCVSPNKQKQTEYNFYFFIHYFHNISFMNILFLNNGNALFSILHFAVRGSGLTTILFLEWVEADNGFSN